ncbi:hypothetical protein H6F90_15200 [Trichocoleus sp. FACHB-591]|uniref:hypothetical protein n=1 Tax=Trichocoleus sp. FACHB-591 TaxID=2692872 RepID=UPI001689A405|nr:hypothetical protein [Trichocoleus sp. FACHB-591]MBD2096484.1 hypothetical protein [Trichocoleus sp. FACHB-591]
MISVKQPFLVAAPKIVLFNYTGAIAQVSILDLVLERSPGCVSSIDQPLID